MLQKLACRMGMGDLCNKKLKIPCRGTSRQAHAVTRTRDHLRSPHSLVALREYVQPLVGLLEVDDWFHVALVGQDWALTRSRQNLSGKSLKDARGQRNAAAWRQCRSFQRELMLPDVP